MSEYRSLTSEEIFQLESQGCTAEDWEKVTVSSDFLPARVRAAQFSGKIRLGSFRSQFVLPGGVVKPCGIYKADLHNVTVGENCRIADVHTYIANYQLDNEVRIENVDCVWVEGSTTFGNGVQVSVLNEAGGREVCMHEALSAQLAYLQCNYRHDSLLQEKIQQNSASYSLSKADSYGTIGAHAVLTNSGILRNVRVGDWAVIDGVKELDEGTVCSTAEAPSYIGAGVIARQFIVQPGSKVIDYAHLTRCFIGESSTIGRGFTATDSLIFANCHFENGEACSLFAGPFTVSHHKSTLLIGMMASFLNAGSGTNQSNHAYKLGPIHYGILERGCRTGSGSYLLWPSRVGAFSTVMGSVKKHIDTSSLPFSYIFGSEDKVYLVPAATLRSIGTWRDAEKWPLRDGRKNPVPADVIDLEILSPYTVSKMLDALEILHQIQSAQGIDNEEYHYQGLCIRRTSLEKGSRIYEQALRYWAGNQILKMDQLNRLTGKENLFSRWAHDLPEEKKWIDMAGMFVTPAILDSLLELLRTGKLISPHDINEAFRRVANESEIWSASSVCGLQTKIWGFPLRNSLDLVRAITLWEKESMELFQEVWKDGLKEFSPEMQLASGLDVDSSLKKMDFENAGGLPGGYPFMGQIEERIAHIRRQAATLLKKYKTG